MQLVKRRRPRRALIIISEYWRRTDGTSSRKDHCGQGQGGVSRVWSMKSSISSLKRLAEGVGTRAQPSI